MFLTARAQTPIFTNRTPDKANVSSTPSPTPLPATLDADPVLFAPGTGPKVVEREPDLAYYVTLRHVSRVLVSDAQGRTDDLFDGRHEDFFVMPAAVHLVRSATYDFLASDSVEIIVPAKGTYSVAFETDQPAFLEIVKGRGNAVPEESIRYHDLALDGRRAKFEITSAGIGPLRLDKDASGRFNSVVEPAANLRGAAARDRSGPRLSFRVLERTASTILIAIDASDSESGVKAVSYSLDVYGDSNGGYLEFPYQRPLRIDLNQAKFLWGFAEDNAANRSVSIYYFNSPQK